MQKWTDTAVLFRLLQHYYFLALLARLWMAIMFDKWHRKIGMGFGDCLLYLTIFVLTAVRPGGSWQESTVASSSPGGDHFALLLWFCHSAGKKQTQANNDNMGQQYVFQTYLPRFVTDVFLVTQRYSFPSSQCPCSCFLAVNASAITFL